MYEINWADQLILMSLWVLLLYGLFGLAMGYLALTDLEWSALLNPSTTNQQHAHMAMRQANWLWHRADPHIANPPDPVTDPISGIWYAYLEQQRPTDVRDGNLHGPALSMARELAQTWAGDAGKMHRLRAANVVAFGTPNP